MSIEGFTFINNAYTVEKTQQSNCILRLFIDPAETELIELYREQIEKHNSSVLTNPFLFANSGFDLFVPQQCVFTNDTTHWINMNIKAEMWLVQQSPIVRPQPFYLYPRSSLSKTPLILANSVGIIDSGYRGFLIGAFKSNDIMYVVEKHVKLLQICHPTLLPFTVILETNFNKMSNTDRGSGAFGSTS